MFFILFFMTWQPNSKCPPSHILITLTLLFQLSNFKFQIPNSKTFKMSQQGRRDFFLKGYAAIYCIAFSSLYVQYRGLYGSDGLEPVEVFLKSKQKRLDATTPNELFWKYPTLAWYHVYLRDVPVDLFMELLCLLGIVLSSHAFLTRCGRSMMCFGSLWLLYLSLYQVGQTFLSFQWDLLLLEAGFLAIWLASPLPTENNEHFEPPQAIVWCLRFLLFKLMAMAGTVKFQSACPTWLNLTALDFHYATQCLPTPVAWLYHQFPPLIQKFSVASTFLIELPATVLLLFPSHSVRKVSVSLQVLLQLLIMFTGNYTYFNLLTLLLCFATLDPTEPCNTTVSKILSLTSIVFLGYSWYFMFEFDQGTLRFRLPAAEFASYFAPAMRICIGLASSSLAFSSIKQISHWIVRLFKSSRKLVGFATLVYLLMGTIVGVAVFSLSLLTFTTLEQSVQGQVPSQVYSLYQKTQIWHIAHPYGLFRRMTGVGEVDVVQSDGTRRKVSNVARPEIILEGTDDNGTTWKPYHFNYKPGEVYKTSNQCMKLI